MKCNYTWNLVGGMFCLLAIILNVITGTVNVFTYLCAVFFVLNLGIYGTHLINKNKRG